MAQALASAANATRWSLIARAQGSGADVRVALGELLSHYERFVIWLIRHYGHPPDTTAEELKQDFLEGISNQKTSCSMLLGSRA